MGDKILLDVRTVTPGVSKKLVPRFKGPYRILKICNNHTVEIQPSKGGKVQLVHVNRKKPLLEAMIWKDEPCPQFQDIRTNEEDLNTKVGLAENPDEVMDETQPALPEDKFSNDPQFSEPFHGFPVAPPRRRRREYMHDPIQRAERPAGLRPCSTIKPREL